MKISQMIEELKKSAKHKDRIPGGKADKKKPSDFDKKQVEMGIKVEMEHTNDPDTAREIALDHLAEFPDYYTRLKEMENKAEKELGKSGVKGMKWNQKKSNTASKLYPSEAKMVLKNYLDKNPKSKEKIQEILDNHKDKQAAIMDIAGILVEKDPHLKFSQPQVQA